ncbi:Transcriptional regulator, TetR family [Alloactinosynnema sp. L-07]|uniref:TetR/AcrR family transcriptional regulator C-terminal domain-containing protein n=1 Tax=Alloactinosynnema sp. L-07 TaxID=1653480 RepID=UPI00065F0715|nr:TetR/AcrR family transcriptional regulator C-terminal domain-containing protein [Alloactinosynnema sp. L-07]CRK59832.1 Transcriptional regulator, TetR family [Alloactinosynnema sp. L-07]
MEDETSRRGPKRSLSADQIVTAAMGMFDGETPSIRGVAARLNVRPNTLYTYLPDRAALERALVDRLLAEADPDVLVGRRGWRRRIEDYAISLREVLLERRGAAALFHAAPMDGPTAAIVGERLLGAFVEAGLDPISASRAAYAVIVHVLGSVALTTADLGDSTEAALVEARSHLAIDPDAFPLTASTLETAATWNTVEQFKWSLRALLEGCVTPPRAS